MKKVIVVKDKCVGCGACTAIAPEVFSMDDEGFAVAKDSDDNSSDNSSVIEAMESCPTNAIIEKNKLK